jgi:hypothetical protein
MLVDAALMQMSDHFDHSSLLVNLFADYHIASARNSRPKRRGCRLQVTLITTVPVYR